ncbi:hypothetical protein BKE38_01170 [Pseudoroseomonas deserti]|uniref:Uncharacterized protein n=1 Tax=Teichococcus deserti TaxID=1817963 RepID=A0A1V2H7Y3_9PROT|nr:hypothetical protein [Pseudoroseomonas deserti]ONG58958.1 hypothetical protein BKE38_01170 [Pseudoroseomonas deserti]
MPDRAPSRLARWLRRRRPDAGPADPAGDAPEPEGLPRGRGPAFGILLGLGIALVFWALLAVSVLR